MEEKSSSFGRKLGITATIVSLAGGTIALWNQLKPEDELPDLSGRWTVTNTVTSSDGGKFDGEVYVYSIGVSEAADHRLTGTGEQTHYQPAGQDMRAAPSRFPVTLTDGKQKPTSVIANFTIKGNREFTGTMRLVRDESDATHLTGTFEYTAGGTQGTTEVRLK
ncbi:MAG TPA: hypothetical protein PLB89_13920 [Flavobacteriales bacterium]|nr:hypothetical protein [Flavobacteriales bacterium]